METATLGFRLYKIWQILKRFSRQLISPRIPNFWRVSKHSSLRERGWQVGTIFGIEYTTLYSRRENASSHICQMESRMMGQLRLMLLLTYCAASSIYFMYSYSYILETNIQKELKIRIQRETRNCFSSFFAYFWPNFGDFWWFFIVPLCVWDIPL